MRTGNALLLPLLLACASPQAADLQSPRLGVTASAHALATRDNLVFPDGRGLPPGSGTIELGAQLFEQRCVSCHGARGIGGPGGELSGGNPDLTAAQPDKTIGSYWPHATTLFDFVRRAMPLHAPWSLSNDEVYALVAYLLDVNDIDVPGRRLDSDTLRAIRMPNRDGFDPIDADWQP